MKTKIYPYGQDEPYEPLPDYEKEEVDEIPDNEGGNIIIDDEANYPDEASDK